MLLVAAAVLGLAACSGSPSVAASSQHRTVSAPVAVSHFTYAAGDYGGGYEYNPGVTDPRPAVIFIHGGGWVRGGSTPAEQAFASGLAAALKWPVFAVNYPVTTVGDTPAFRGEPDAINNAVHYVAGLPTTDPAHIILWGESAGGNLALLDAERDAAHTHPRVSAAVSISGPTDMRAEWQICDAVIPNNNFVTQYEGETPGEADVAGHGRYDTTSPAGNSVAAQPPIFQAVGEDDAIAPPGEITAMDTDARSVGAGSVVYVLPGVSDHAADLEPDVIPATGNTVERQAELFLFGHAATRS